MRDHRNHIFDAIKALAIFLVILGHCIQYLSGLDYWNNSLFQFIYSFHMPLFFMVSGFFFPSSVELVWYKFLRKKALTLLLPCIAWGIIYACINYESWNIFVANVITPYRWPFWFFKGLFLVQVTGYICLRIASRMGCGIIEMLAFAIIGSLLVYFLPGMAVPRVMMLIFWVGYIMNIYYDKFNKYYQVIGVVSAILFSGLYGFWNEETMHYSASASVTIYHVLLGRHGYTMMNLLWLLYRIVLGITGSLAIISLLHEFKNINGYIKKVGQSTAGIYVLQSLIIEKWLRISFCKYVDLSGLSLVHIYGLMLLISGCLVVFITYIYQLIKHYVPIADIILFGSGIRRRSNYEQC